MRRAFVIAGLMACLAGALPAQTREVRGRVTAAEGGAPVSGAQVVLLAGGVRGGVPERIGTTTTDASGGFVLEVPEGRQGLGLRVTAPGLASSSGLLRGRAGQELAIVLGPGIVIRGRVVDADDRRPITGARVRIGADTVETDGEGRFELPGFPAAEAVVAAGVHARGYGFGGFEVPTPAEGEELEFALKPGRVHGVRVVNDAGEPIEGARVLGWLPFAEAYTELERADFSGTTDGQGLALLDEIPPGYALVVEASHEGLITAQSPLLAPRAAGQPGAPVTLVLSPGRRADFIVMDDFGRAIAGAEVNLLPLIEPRQAFGGYTPRDMTRGPSRTADTDSEGRLSLDLLPAGLLTVEARAPGHQTVLTVIDTSGPGGEPARLRLPGDPAPPGTQIPWAASLAEAFGRSRAESLPVWVFMTMDGERANDWMAGHHLRNPETVRLARELPVVLSSAFGPGGVVAGGTEHGEIDGICARYGGVPCAVHQAAEAFASSEYLPGITSFQVPREILVTPAGEVILHRTYYLTERDLQRVLMAGLRAASPARARRLARQRLGPLLRELTTAQADGQPASAGERFLALVNAGDEHAAAIAGALADSGVPADLRLAILEGLLPESVRFPESLLAGFASDPEPAIRRLAWQRLAASGPTDAALGLLASHLDDADPEARRDLQALLGVSREEGGFRVRDALSGGRGRIVAELALRFGADSVPELVTVLTGADSASMRPLLRRLAARAAMDPGAWSALLAVAARPGRESIAALAALGALAVLPDEGAAADILVTQADSADELVRETALEILAARRLPGSLRALRGALADPILRIRLRAAVGLLDRGHTDGAQALLDGYEDPLLQAEAQAALRAWFGAEAPRSSSGWRYFLQDRGLL